MLKHHRQHFPFLVFALTFILVISFSIPWVNAQVNFPLGKENKTRPQEWHINGIFAALDDEYLAVQGKAFEKVAEYEFKDLNHQKAEILAKKAVKILKDKNVDSDIRSAAAAGLGSLGDVAKPYVKEIIHILKDENNDVRSAAAGALESLGVAVKPYSKEIIDITKDKTVYPNIRFRLAEVLEDLGIVARPYIKDITDITDINEALNKPDVDGYIRTYMSDMTLIETNAITPNIKEIVNTLKNKNADYKLRVDTARKLASHHLGDDVKPYMPYIKDILNVMKEKNVEIEVPVAAAQALLNLGDLAKPHVQNIVEIFKDKSIDSSIRSLAVIALGNLGDATEPYIKDILNIIKDQNFGSNIDGDYLGSDIHINAAKALGNLGDIVKPYTKDIIDILKDKNFNSDVRINLAQALGKIKQLQLSNLVAILDNIYYAGQTEFPQWRFLSYFLGGGTDETNTLLQWVGYPQPESIPKKLNRAEAIKTLKVFSKAWESTQGLERLRRDLAEQTSIVVSQKQVIWQPQDILLLQNLKDQLKSSGYGNKAASIDSVINNLNIIGGIYRARNIILIHLAFWLLLIFAYPKSPQVQAIFFWNPWVRRILGMGYVGFLLTWVPFFRRKLLQPFQFSLLADAELDNFHPDGYFPNSGVLESGKIRPITTAIPEIKGQIILEGDSGLGKSIFLRHLLQTASRTVVYLPAYKCENGVITAIQVKLHGQAQDAAFLQNLIYSGAIDICIDGLNEVTADTRAKICQFVESYFRGNIIMTTQPLEWKQPKTAKTYYLQSLTPQQIEDFLISRTPLLPPDAKVRGEDYAQACKSYLNQTLHSQLSPEELSANRRILSNPMDLTLVSLMMAQGNYPNLFQLQQQQYTLMAREYLQEWKHEFPLKKFAQTVYKMRLNDQQTLPSEEFHQELLSMADEKYKMVITRQWISKNGEFQQEWYFRHDKIMEFFLAQNFLGEEEEIESRLLEHLGDPRFSGMYFLLGNLLPVDAAKELREQLIQYAADSKDHTVSDTFVQILRTR